MPSTRIQKGKALAVQIDEVRKSFEKKNKRTAAGKQMQTKDKGLKVVIEELKQVIVQSPKLIRYKTRTEQYVQNRRFQTNQTKLFERLEKENRSYEIRPGVCNSGVGSGTNQLVMIIIHSN